MYRHLLVPVDSSDLTLELAEHAAGLAKTLGAKISFLTITGDFGSTSDGAVLRTIDPDRYEYGTEGWANTLVARAEATAQKQGVTSHSYIRKGEDVAVEILTAAEELGCDLIIMASHGMRGLRRLFSGSKTQRVLNATRIPVLVTTTDSDPRARPARAVLTILGKEHRAISVVAKHIASLAAACSRNTGFLPSSNLLTAMVEYLDVASGQLHHNREEQQIFARLRLRCPGLATPLNELAEQHKLEEHLIAEFRKAVDSILNFRDSTSFIGAARRLVDLIVKHMGFEDSVILPAARDEFTADDWREIAEVFLHDSRAEGSSDLEIRAEQLFARVVTEMKHSRLA